MFDTLKTSLSALGANPLRTTLSTLGVVIGVASLVAILALGDGLERFSRDQLEQTTDLQAISISPQTTRRQDGILVRRQQITRLTRADFESLGDSLGPGYAFARALSGAGWVETGDSSLAVLVLAGDPEGVDMIPDPLDQGRLWGVADTAEAVIPAVLSASAAHLLGSNDTLAVDGRALQIVGSLAGDIEARPARIYVPLSRQTETWLGATGRVPSITVKADRIEDVEVAVERARAWANARFQPGSVTVNSSLARVQQASQAMLVFKLALGAIAGVSLLVGGIGIMNILLASVSERTREIGIRKAIGARQIDVRRQFMIESIAVAGLGSLIGLALGIVGAIGIAAVIRQITEAPVYAAFTWPSLLAAAGIALAIGLIFGTYPARRAAKLSPVDAIRHE